MQREHDDYTLTPCGNLGGKTGVSQGGKFLGEFSDNVSALEFVRQHMEDNQYWPSIWWVSDHGNEWPIDLDGEELTIDDDEDDDEDDPEDYDPELMMDGILERQELEDFENCGW